jgi:membrane protease YdiL (CAAX protease family)
LSEAAPRWRRILVLIATTFVALFLAQLAWLPSQKLFGFPARWMRGAAGPNDLLGAGIFLVSCIVATWVILRFLAPRDDRRPAPLAMRLREASIGFALGAGQIGFDIAVLALLGAYRVVAVGDPSPALVGFVVMLGVAAIEEAALRAVMLPRLERLVGPWWALFGTSMLFGLAHLFNPNASALAALAIGLEAGFALGGLYLLTRRLWAPVAMHLAWNWMCGPVLGVPLSGALPPSFVQARLEGPDWLTGGAFGPEASVIEIIAGAAIAAAILWRLQRQIATSRPAHSMSVTPAS